jgi:uncharacterized protein (TIGR00106 family)
MDMGPDSLYRALDFSNNITGNGGVMSTIVHLSIFPLDKGEHLSSYVARAVRIIRESGLPHHLGPMGTTIEGEWQAVMDVVNRCFEELRKDCGRIIVNLKADYKKDAENRMTGKVASVEEKMVS